MRAGRRKSGMATALAGIAALLLCLAGLRTYPAATELLSEPLFDTYQRLQPRPATELPPVAVVDIDEASIARLGQWPWPRDVIARMVDRLAAAGVAAIGFDIVFSEPDRLSLQKAAEDLRKRGARVDLPAGTAMLDNDVLLAQSESGGAKVGHGSGGIMLLRAE